MDPSSVEEDSSTHSSPLGYVIPNILEELKHLDLTGRVVFEESQVIANGAYGDICRAHYKHDRQSETTVAIKRMRFYMKEDIKALFEKEIYVWAKLRHNNILPLLGYAFEQKTKYPLLVSEWMENGSAWDFVISNPNCDLMHIITDVAHGLAYLHENGVVHSDIKSDNVLISRSGDALLCDFGFSRMITASRTYAKISTTIKGTDRYMAPEFFNIPDSKHSKKTDVWAFGMTVFELLARQRPFANVHPLAVPLAISRLDRPSLPNPSMLPTTSRTRESLWEICQMCWKKNPEDRVDIVEISVWLEDNVAIAGDNTTENDVLSLPSGKEGEQSETHMAVSQHQAHVSTDAVQDSLIDSQIDPTASIRFRNLGTNRIRMQIFDAELRSMSEDFVLPENFTTARNLKTNVPINFILTSGRRSVNFSRVFYNDQDIDLDQIINL
ncbi:hypothetical protein ACEPAI_4470 [Sanghuangporus weigelae]